MVERVEGEPLGFARPGFADALVEREAFQGLEAAGEVVGLDEGGEVRPELVVVLVVVTPDGGLVDGPVHSLDLPIGPRVPRLGQAMLHIVAGTSELEAVRPEELAALTCLLDVRHGGRRVAGWPAPMKWSGSDVSA